MYIELLFVVVILIFAVINYFKQGDSVYSFLVDTTGKAYDKFAPYSFKLIREKVKEMGLSFKNED